MNEGISSATDSLQPIRAPGVVIFAVLTSLIGLGWLRIAWVLRTGRFQLTIPKEAIGAIPTMIGLGVFCLVIALGLFLRHRWARYATLSLAGFWLLIGLVVALVLGYSIVAQPRFGIGLAVNLIIAAGAVGLPASYVAYFCRRPIRQFFAPKIPKPRQRPLGISLIAWWHIVSAVLVVPALRQYRTPVIQLFGLMFHGVPALAVQFLLAAWSLILGIGLLRGRYWAWLAAISYEIFLGVSGVVSGLFPRFREFEQYFKEPLPKVFSPHHYQMIAIGSAAGAVLFSLVLIGLLMRYRPFFPKTLKGSPDLEGIG